MLGFRGWLEARTYAHQGKIVYHWSTESSWNKVLQKQKIGLWVSPNSNMNDFWASWLVSGNDHENRMTYYLHKIMMPRDLYAQYIEKERGTWAPHAVRELVIVPQHWNLIRHVGVTEHRRSELLKRSVAADRRREQHRGWEPGRLNSFTAAFGGTEENQWRMGQPRNRRPSE